MAARVESSDDVAAGARSGFPPSLLSRWAFAIVIQPRATTVPNTPSLTKRTFMATPHVEGVYASEKAPYGETSGGGSYQKPAARRRPVFSGGVVVGGQKGQFSYFTDRPAAARRAARGRADVVPTPPPRATNKPFYLPAERLSLLTQVGATGRQLNFSCGVPRQLKPMFDASSLPSSKAPHPRIRAGLCRTVKPAGPVIF